MTSTPEPVKQRLRIAHLVWLAAYLATIAVVVLGMLAIRRTTLREMDTPEARAQWQAWRDASVNQESGGPVRRRPPSSSEPPSLVLMRDYFGVVMSGALVFGSLLFAAIMLAAHGVFSADNSKSIPG